MDDFTELQRAYLRGFKEGFELAAKELHHEFKSAVAQVKHEAETVIEQINREASAAVTRAYAEKCNSTATLN
jgi:hypothetical protein